ncbi:hypothetical protein J4E91_000436 [Alternaria rosae]|nr:hypothetical protein J4E91_000436 [Alternaria rosae]
MLSPLTLGLVLLPLLSAAYPEEPPTTAAPDTVADCTWWQVAAETDTCASISEYWGLTDAQFTTYYISECFYSTFFSINGVQSQCWQHGGNDCANQAAAAVCPDQ